MDEATLGILERLSVPMFWIDPAGRRTWCNEAGRAVLKGTDSNLWADISQSLPDGYIYHIHGKNGPRNGFLVECIPDRNASVDSAALRELRERNAQLELIFQEMFDEVYVTDGNGVTLRVNKATERLYGMRQSDLIGRSVYELEQQGVFYPSGIAEVLRRRTQTTLLQSTKEGKRLVSTATPVFDDAGNITFVISTAKDVSEIPVLDSPFVQNEQTAHHVVFDKGDMVSRAPKMQSVLQLVERLAPTDATLLILGETGVGKNLLAEYIHQRSPRCRDPFIDVNCAAIPESLLESELFGYEGGAFTGALRSGKPGKVELAHNGTLFLNEIGELPLHLQGKLLDFIQGRTLFRIGGLKAKHVDTRILAATNRNLHEMVKEGLFRADLYYRLNVVPVEIPPLRDRIADIVALTDLFLSTLTSKYRQPPKEISTQTLRIMSEYPWPGNVRELENLIERLVLTVDERVIQPHHLPASLRGGETCQQNAVLMPAVPTKSDVPLRQMVEGAQVEGSPLRLLEVLERTIYEEALRTYQSTYRVAEVLGVSQPTVVRKVKQFELR